MNGRELRSSSHPLYPADGMNISMKQFFDIKDYDLQKYIYTAGMVNTSSRKIQHVDNDKKTAWYHFTESIAVGRSNYYIKKGLLEWLVYDKTTKKVKAKMLYRSHGNRISTGSPEHDVQLSFLHTYFADIPLIRDFIPGSLTAAFCKKVIEGKIRTVEDLLKYQRSYIYRNKNIPLEVLLQMKIYGMDGKLKYIENFDLFKEDSGMEALSDLEPTQLMLMGWKIKEEKDLDKKYLQNEYDKWITTQRGKYDEIRKRGVSEASINHAVF